MTTELMLRRSYRIRLVTPAFVAGADQQRPALRVPSIRGCLRWWYRLALKAQGHARPAIARQEADLFGSTIDGQRLVLRLLHVRPGVDGAPPYHSLALDHQYLWFALRPRRGSAEPLARPAVPAKTTFGLDVLVPSHLEDAEARLARVEDVLRHWVLFGGIGLRCRRGAGSLWFDGTLPDGKRLPTDFDVLRRELTRLAGPLNEICDLVLSPETYGNWQDAITAAGQRYRGRRGQVRALHGRQALPALGWPILNFPGDGRLTVNGRENDRAERLASPVWLKVVPDGDRFRWLLLVVKAPFWSEIRSSLGVATAEEVLSDFANGFDTARPSPPRGPRARESGRRGG
jgi:CRISPR type III-B/RAMP module RAMP protein Cmr1